MRPRTSRLCATEDRAAQSCPVALGTTSSYAVDRGRNDGTSDLLVVSLRKMFGVRRMRATTRVTKILTVWWVVEN